MRFNVVFLDVRVSVGPIDFSGSIGPVEMYSYLDHPNRENSPRYTGVWIGSKNLEVMT